MSTVRSWTITAIGVAGAGAGLALLRRPRRAPRGPRPAAAPRGRSRAAGRSRGGARRRARPAPPPGRRAAGADRVGRPGARTPRVSLAAAAAAAALAALGASAASVSGTDAGDGAVRREGRLGHRIAGPGGGHAPDVRRVATGAVRLRPHDRRQLLGPRRRGHPRHLLAARAMPPRAGRALARGLGQRRRPRHLDGPGPGIAATLLRLLSRSGAGDRARRERALRPRPTALPAP